MTVRGIGKKIERVGIPLLIIFILLSIRYTNFFQYTEINSISIRIFGVAILIIGIIIHIYSACIMLKGFKMKKLVTSGPYAFCRNPMYSTIFFLITPGLSFAMNSWIFLFAIPILLSIFLMNIKEEDEFLQVEFEEEYHRYKKSVKLLIPKLF